MPPERLVPDVRAWYRAHRRDLPWRGQDVTPWGVLVSEVMLQQTPVARVEPVWRDWLERWPTPTALAAASPAEVVRAWGRLGYPRRALRLREAAAAILADHDGVVPADERVLVTLPGIGAYTAAAVAAFGYGRRAVVLDTNVRRVLARAVDGGALPRPTQTRPETLRAEALVPAEPAAAAEWAVAAMELGALVCTARAPRCEDCPIADRCAWRAAGYPPDAFAARRRTQPWQGTDRQVRGAIMAVLRDLPEHASAPRATLAAGAPDPEQFARALAGLVTDGLVERLPADRYRLPS